MVSSSSTATLCTTAVGVVCGILGNLGLNLGGVGIGVSNVIVYSAEADCPAGKVAIGGGGSTGTLAGLLATSAPTDGTGHGVLVGSGAAHGWIVVDTGVSSLSAFVICA